MAASPASIVQSTSLGSFISKLCPSELVPGNKVSSIHAATPASALHHRTLQVRPLVTSTSFRHMLQKGNKNSMSRKHKTKIATQPSYRTTNSPARWINKKKCGRPRVPGSTCRPGTSRHHRVRGKMDPTVRLQNKAVRALLLSLAPGEESGTGRILEYLSNTLAGSSRALEVMLGADLLSNCHTLHMSWSGAYLISKAANNIPPRGSLASDSSSSVLRSPLDRV
jgi:hypothetical protein